METKMNRFFKLAALTATAASFVLAPIAQAAAHDRWKHHRHHRPTIVKKNNTDELIAAGIIGLAVGALIVGAASQPKHRRHRAYRHDRPRRDRDYFPQRPGVVYDEPRVIYDRHASAEPWSPAWYNYCENRFRSFDARTGTYLGYDGKRHFCVAR